MVGGENFQNVIIFTIMDASLLACNRKTLLTVLTAITMTVIIIIIKSGYSS